MPRPPLLYRATALIARATLSLATLARPRLRVMTRGRRESTARFHAWAAAERSSADPVILLHAASAGELRQLEPVLHRLRATHPSWRLALTWFSDSAALVGATLPADVAGYLPWDTPWEIGRLLERVRPSLIVLSKLDLWPELAWQAERRHIPVALIAATVRPNSGRLRWPARAALEGAYRSLSAVGAVSSDDAGRLALLGVDPTRIEITGDPRYDAVVERLQRESSPAVASPLLVAGSLWAADEVVLLQAFAEVRRVHATVRLLLVPHQPTEAVTRRITALALALGLPAPIPFAADAEGAPLLVESRPGRLALLYPQGTIAYVGGGFGNAGLHSVLEPAAAGVPVIVGPRWEQSQDAVALSRTRGFLALSSLAPVEQLAGQWLRWLEREQERAAAGREARATVLQGRGAADRSAELIERLVFGRESQVESRESPVTNHDP